MAQRSATAACSSEDAFTSLNCSVKGSWAGAMEEGEGVLVRVLKREAVFVWERVDVAVAVAALLGTGAALLRGRALNEPDAEGAPLKGAEPLGALVAAPPLLALGEPLAAPEAASATLPLGEPLSVREPRAVRLALGEPLEEPLTEAERTARSVTVPLATLLGDGAEAEGRTVMLTRPEALTVRLGSALAESEEECGADAVAEGERVPPARREVAVGMALLDATANEAFADTVCLPEVDAPAEALGEAVSPEREALLESKEDMLLDCEADAEREAMPEKLALLELSELAVKKGEGEPAPEADTEGLVVNAAVAVGVLEGSGEALMVEVRAADAVANEHRDALGDALTVALAVARADAVSVALLVGARVSLPLGDTLPVALGLAEPRMLLEGDPDFVGVGGEEKAADIMAVAQEVLENDAVGLAEPLNVARLETEATTVLVMMPVALGEPELLEEAEVVEK